jgi:ornithine carbamoyltransferase
MHCLPADIGAEVDEKIFEQHRMFMYEEANKKPYVIAAAIASSLIPDLQKELLKRAK